MIALFILIAVSTVTVIDIGGVFVAPAYPGNQAEGAGFTVLFIWAPALVVVSLLGAAALFLARTGLGGVFIAIGLTGDLLSSLYLYIAGGIGPPGLAITLMILFLVALNVGAIYGAWVFIFRPHLGRH